MTVRLWQIKHQHPFFIQDTADDFAGLLGVEVSKDQPLMEAGLDSIGAVELRNSVSAKFGVELPATVTFDQPTVQNLAQFLAGRVAPPAGQFAVGAVTHALQTGPDTRALTNTITQVQTHICFFLLFLSNVCACLL